MGRQSSRIWYRNKDHKEMVLWDGSGYQYHDKAYIWTGSEFELVWEKIKGLKLKQLGIYFYYSPIVIRNNDGSVKYYIDYDNNGSYRKIYPDGSEDTIQSTSTVRPTPGQTYDFSADMGYTVLGKLFAVGNTYRLTNPEISWGQRNTVFSLYDIDNLSSIISRSSMRHSNYQTVGGQQGWIYNILSSGRRWAESNGNYKGFGVYYNYGTTPYTCYVRVCNVFTNTATYADYAYPLPSTYTSIEGSYYIYSDFISACYYTYNHSKDYLSVFYQFTDVSTGQETIALAYEFELPYQHGVSISRVSLLQVDEKTLLQYQFDGLGSTELKYCFIDISCPNYVPFDYSTMEFEIIKDGICDLDSIIESCGHEVRDVIVTGQGEISGVKYLYMDLIAPGGASHTAIRYNIESDIIQIIDSSELLYHTSGSFDICPEDEKLIVNKLRGIEPYNFALCELEEA